MAHALLSPSAASRWMVCTPSARLEAQFPDSAGQAASEGTLAHELAELLLKNHLKRITKTDYKHQLKLIQANVLYTDSMLEYADEFKSFVLEQFEASGKDSRIFLEKRLDMTDYIQEGFGTGDVVIIADHTLTIIDLKYGKGVLVNATENKQMMLYALGALKDYYLLYDILRVQMTIYQPRINNFSTWEISLEDLMVWAENELKPRAALAWEGTGELIAGDHCQFCRAKATCRANMDYQLELARHEFKQPDLITPAEVSDILTRAKSFKNWLDAVESFALAEALNGAQWPGFKLVEGRSNRVITDEQAAAQQLLEAGYDETDIYKPKAIFGITALEANIGKKEIAKYLNNLIEKPPGKPTLVSEDDKRPALNSTDAAIKDFS